MQELELKRRNEQWGQHRAQPKLFESFQNKMEKWKHSPFETQKTEGNFVLKAIFFCNSASHWTKWRLVKNNLSN